MTLIAITHPDAVVMAANHLRGTSARVLDIGWHAPGGQLDIVAMDRDTLVVVDVRTRQRGRYSAPLEKISTVRVSRLRRLGVAWTHAHGARFDQIRVDVIAVSYDGPGGHTIEHAKAVG